ncbi:hypothetical protein OUQ99_03935 [Streptomonospora nanhaiensis]|uniref:Uncharacterized protein n=1 Tax=Streptomonospora nanhaiensis TaxID=1323731 RepID=A0ABY6YPV5_9ACTN|nr:hypothetical protein [Streptomonospora nanhaiensis]WAE74281.1 hypothetical protein OUQ99_03935 [Streptomonospora nanhaiensis]
MGPLEQQEALVSIASSLPKYFPPNWKAAIYHVEIMGLSADEFIEVEQEDGEIVRTDLPPDSGMKCMKLRAGMYKENEGTWFSFKLKLWSEGTYRSEFNYEDPPKFLFGPDLNEYARDIKLFPRSEDFTPAWLQEKIDEANSARGN